MSSEIGNFTPVPHSLAQEVGLVCAAVYGVVWRYCQMKDGICRASLDTLGSDINVDRATVMRSVKKLCELGYLIDQTPARRNAPHTYILAKSVAECNSPEVEAVAPNNSSSPTVAECNATVAESHLKIDSKKDSKDNIAANAPLLPDTKYSHLLFEKLAVEFGAKGRRPPAKFPSLACKRKFDARAKYLNGNTAMAIDRALEKGILAVTGVTDFIAKWNPPPPTVEEPTEKIIAIERATGQEIRRNE